MAELKTDNGANGEAKLGETVAEAKPANANMRVWVKGQTIEGNDVKKGVLLPMGERGPARERFKKIGLTVMTLGDEVSVGALAFGSKAEKLGLETGFKFTGVEVPATRPDKESAFIPALLLLGLIIAVQRAR